MSLDKLTGLEILKSIIAGSIPHPSIAQTVPMKFEVAEEGRVLFRAMATDDHLNPVGGTHGGFACTVLDSVTGCAVHTTLAAGVRYGTIDLAVKMVRPVPRDVWLVAEGKVINVSRSLGVSEGTLRDETGKLYAHATCTCMIMRPAGI